LKKSSKEKNILACPKTTWKETLKGTNYENNINELECGLKHRIWKVYEHLTLKQYTQTILTSKNEYHGKPLNGEVKNVYM